ncbi:MAG: phage minor head protein [Pseudomonadota bacterium]
MDTFTFDTTPPQEVVAFFDEKGLRPAFDYRDTWGIEHVTSFTVAKATQTDVLATIQADVSKAIRQGVPFEQFRKDLTPRLQELGWWGRKEMTDPLTGETAIVQLGSPRRLQTIYWANTRTARAAGQWQRAQRTKRVSPYFVYGLGNSRNHRPEHVAKAGVILPVDHPFWDQWFPPNGWGCKCWLRQIGRTEAESLGGESDEPDITSRQFVNERSGETSMVPDGIDPGWATNSGKERYGTLRRELDTSLGAVDDQTRRKVIGASPLAEFVSGAINNRIGERAAIPFAAISDKLANTLGTKARAVMLSSDTIRQHVGKANSEDYAELPQRMIDEGELWRDRRGKLSLIMLVGDRPYVAGLKVTRFDELFMTTLHEWRARSVEKIRERGERVN